MRAKNNMTREKIKEIFGKLKILYREQDIEKLYMHICLFEEKGLTDITERLISQNKKSGFLETLTEHNFTADLLTQCNGINEIEYEPKNKNTRPIDLRLSYCDINYWIQIKKSAQLERDNRREKFFNKIEKLAQKIPINKFFDAYVHYKNYEKLGESDFNELMSFIKEKASTSNNNETYAFENGSLELTLTFGPVNDELHCLTCGETGDKSSVETTESSKDQLRKGLIKAAEAFSWDTDEKTINLIVIERPSSMFMDRNSDKLIYSETGKLPLWDVIFGTECVISTLLPSNRRWTRQDDGFFKNACFSHKIAGIVAIARKEPSIISEYDKSLYLNPSFKYREKQISALIKCNKIF